MKKENRITKTRVGLALPVALLMAANGWGLTIVESTNYIDEYGRPAQMSNCVLIDEAYLAAHGTNLQERACFVVNSTLSFDKRIYSTHDIILILSDNANFTVNFEGGQHAFEADNHDIKIYGQKNQLGSLIVNNTGDYGRGISAQNIYIYGGHVSATSKTKDAIWAQNDIDIYGGYISATTSAANTYVGIESETGNINVNWANSLYASSYSTPNGALNVASGLTLNGSDGNTYSSTNAPVGDVTQTPDYLVQFVTNGDNSKRVVINGEYTGTESVNIPSPVDVVAIDYNRTFTVGVASTVVLPFELPAGTEINAEFFYLYDVYQNGCAWRASMKYIGDGMLPEPNKPYAVVLKEEKITEGKIIFNLNGGVATVGSASEAVTSTEDRKWHFIGTYTYKEWKTDADGLGLAYGFAGSNNDDTPKGKFGKISRDTEDPEKVPFAKPLRAYLQKDNAGVQLVCASGRPAAPGEIVSNIPEVIDVDFIKDDENGEHTTFVGRWNTRTGEFQMKRDYDLKGRKINNAPKARGAYYGKKVLKK